MNSRELLSKFPAFAKPSYEAFIHKKVDDADYDVLVAIPSGKRAFLWFTMSGKEEICCIIEIGRNHMLQDNIHKLDWKYPQSFSLGTLLSGYLLDGDELCPNHKYFIADDLFSFQGYEFGNPFPNSFARKFEAFTDFFNTIKHSSQNGLFSIHCVVMWNRTSSEELPLEWVARIGYKVKHIQYRSSQKVLPFSNLIVSKNPWECGGPQLIEDAIDYVPKSTIWSDITMKYKKEMKIWNVNFFLPIHKQKTLFLVSADIAYDIYYLHVQQGVLFQHAFIPNLKTSMMMNKIFRRIAENDCLDKVEESEDEEEFENIRCDKYVDLEKKVLMECVFHPKFKKWVPVKPMLGDNLGKYVPRIDDFLFLKHNGNTQQHQDVRKQFNQPSNYVRGEKRGGEEKGGDKKKFFPKKKMQQQKQPQQTNQKY